MSEALNLALVGVPTEELLDELGRRSHAFVAAWTEDDRQTWSGFHAGGAVAAIGLCEVEKAYLLVLSQEDP